MWWRLQYVWVRTTVQQNYKQTVSGAESGLDAVLSEAEAQNYG